MAQLARHPRNTLNAIPYSIGACKCPEKQPGLPFESSVIREYHLTASLVLVYFNLLYLWYHATSYSALLRDYIRDNVRTQRNYLGTVRYGVNRNYNTLLCCSRKASIHLVHPVPTPASL